MEFKSNEDVIGAINQIRSLIQNERKREQNLKIRYAALSQIPVVAGNNPKSLKEHLDEILPPSLIPANVGNIDSIAWPFWYQFDFDFGTNPTLSTSLRQTQSVQITQEAGFLMMGLSRDSEEVSLAGSLGPWTIESIKDRQSSRQFNNQPINFQAIGKGSNISVFPTPLLFFPNAFIDITMGCFQTTPNAVVGRAKHQISVFGYRVRMGDDQRILSTIFG
jgi:hypothetical protein